MKPVAMAFVLTLLALLAVQMDSAMGTESTRKPLPAWITQSVTSLRASRSRDVVEEATYKGDRAFLFTSGYRFDTGDEHTLFRNDGKIICQFGGFVGHVTSGSCDLDKITYVRTIYSGAPQPKHGE